MRYFACIDIGGTEIKYGVVSEDTKILTKGSMPTEAEKGPKIWMQNIVSVVDKMKSEYELSGICVSSTAMINSDKGTVVFSLPQVPDYTGFDIKGFLESGCKLQCEVENDVNAAVLAESLYGSGKGFDSVLGLCIGTGIGGGFFENGKILHGATYSACEVGYIKAGDGDLEHEGSASALCRRVENMKNAESGSWDGYRVFAQAKAGDEDCIKAIDKMAYSIAQGLVSLTYVLNPAVIVLGGGVMNEDLLFSEIIDYYNKKMNPMILNGTKICKAKFGNDAGLIGAMCHFVQKHSD